MLADMVPSGIQLRAYRCLLLSLSSCDEETEKADSLPLLIRILIQLWEPHPCKYHLNIPKAPPPNIIILG